MQRIRMKNKTDEKTWSEKEYQHTIGLATKAVKALLVMEQKEKEFFPRIEEVEISTYGAIDDVIRIIWILHECKKEYWVFKREFLEAIEVKMKEELES